MVQNTEMAHRGRWLILAVLWITYIVVFLSRLSVGPLAPFLKEDLGITNAQVGLIMSAAALGYAVSGLPTGWVVDKIGAKWPIVIGEFIAGITMMALFIVPSYISMLILMFVVGVGCGFLMPSTTQGVIAWFPPRERATVMGLKQTGVNVGGILSAVTLPAVALALGWRYGFLFLGMIAIAVGAMALVLYKNPPASTSSNSEGSAAAHKPSPLLELLKSREIWLVALCGFCLTWVEMAMIAHLVVYLKEVWLFPVVAAGGLLAMTEAAGGIARPGSGLLSDRVFAGKRRPVFMLIAGVTSVMCLLMGLSGPHLSWGLYPALFVLGLAGVGFGGIYLTLLSEFAGLGGAGKAVGLGGIFCTTGAALGPPLFGHIVDITGSYGLAWLSLALVAALCVPLLLFIREEKRKL